MYRILPKELVKRGSGDGTVHSDRRLLLEPFVRTALNRMLPTRSQGHPFEELAECGVDLWTLLHKMCFRDIQVIPKEIYTRGLEQDKRYHCLCYNAGRDCYMVHVRKKLSIC